jgi:hypothetical protein
MSATAASAAPALPAMIAGTNAAIVAVRAGGAPDESQFSRTGRPRSAAEREEMPALRSVATQLEMREQLFQAQPQLARRARRRADGQLRVKHARAAHQLYGEVFDA